MHATHSHLPPVFEARTYVVSQLEVFLARQLIVHSFDQLQDLQREEAGTEEMEERDEFLKDVRLLELAQRGAECFVESLRRQRLSELRIKQPSRKAWRRYKMIDGVYCHRLGERLGQGSCCVSISDARQRSSRLLLWLVGCQSSCKTKLKFWPRLPRAKPMKGILVVYYIYLVIYTPSSYFPEGYSAAGPLVYYH